MRTPHSTDDLRDELRLQARETESWDLPAVALPRRTPPRRAWAVLAVSAALVVAVLVVPGWLGGQVTPLGEPGRPAASPSEPSGSVAEVVDYEVLAPRCSDRTQFLELDEVGPGGGTFDVPDDALTEVCDLPVQVLSEGRELELAETHRFGPDTRDAFELGMYPVPEDGYWLMFGDESDASRPSRNVSVDGGPVTVVPAGRGPALVRLPSPTTGGQDLVVTQPDGTADDEPVTIGLYRRSQPDLRLDWETTLAACEQAEPDCAAPETIRLGDTDLVRAGGGTPGREDPDEASVEGTVGDRPNGSWLMVGDLEGRRDQTLTVRLDGFAPAFVDAARPVLVRLPDDGSVPYSITTRATGRHRLFAAVYEPAG